MLKAKLAPSMMCVNVWDDPAKTLSEFERFGIDYLHIDIMDGHFVPNLTLGTDYVKQLRRRSDIPLDIHLMVEKPESILGWFDIQPGEYVSVHVESTVHLQRALAAIHSLGAKTMAALNPATPLSSIEEVLDDLDAVLLMTVNPGYSGQSLVPQTIGKIRRLRDWLDSRGYGQVEIEVDGNVSFANTVKMRSAGANIFVAGTSSIFFAGDTIESNIAKMRESLLEGETQTK